MASLGMGLGASTSQGGERGQQPYGGGGEAAAAAARPPQRHGRGTQVGSSPAYEYPPPEPGFQNFGLQNWQQDRKAWTARPPGYRRQHKKPQLPSDITYEEVLGRGHGTCAPFPRPVPLPEMVEFLLDIWEDDGLY